MQALQAQSTQALDRLQALKGKLVELDQDQARTGLNALLIGLRRRRLEACADAVERVRLVWRAFEDATELGEQGEWEGCLGLVEEVEEALLSPASADGVRFGRLKAMQGVPARLARLRQRSRQEFGNGIVDGTIDLDGTRCQDVRKKLAITGSG